MITLRPYQHEAIEAATNHMARSISPGLLSLATGAGKSLIVAAIANWLAEKSGKKVLCLAPSRELTEQNAERHRSMFGACSFYSASLGRSLRESVVFGTPRTVENRISHFGKQFAGVLIDEAHEGLRGSIRIVDKIRLGNPNLRVIGCTATPYRQGTGYIYAAGIDGMVEEDAIDPWFSRLLYEVTARQLIDQGFLTPPNADPIGVAAYDTSRLEVASTGSFTASSVEQAFEGQGRVTSDIVADVVAHSRGRRGVMLFASTVRHAKEILASLPPGSSEMIGGDTNMGGERPGLIDRFKRQVFKYLVSVGTLTRGFDASHVDVVAILRATESPVLLQQIIGRGLRLHPGKSDVLVLDYAGNVERHGLEHDLFSPQIKLGHSGGSGEKIQAVCEWCQAVNEFAARENEHGYGVDENGYFTTLGGERIESENGFLPAHYGRRCAAMVAVAGEDMQCSYRWTFKGCGECGHENDIAARYCESCKAELVDPNEKLERDFKRMKSDPSQVSTDYVREWKVEKWLSMKGRESVKVTFKTDYAKIEKWYRPERRSEWCYFSETVFGAGRVAPDIDALVKYHSKGRMPETITAFRPRGSRFYEVTAFNRPADEVMFYGQNSTSKRAS